ncbi:hypothetical protein BDU57DRAFT_371521 [Ampelomyces quisqualis]|uniref:Uncharacterized protein n=1 Tax=Ampelomyces quisqualis TaxID=50730 RepID=A0A6A5QEI7_AMPQU|nr:hypothetical protein BDU57DRAFT_371521 [Ampelomyces quisqualis]
MLLHANGRARPCLASRPGRALSDASRPVLQSSRLRPFVRPSERRRIISQILRAPHSPRSTVGFLARDLTLCRCSLPDGLSHFSSQG